MRYSSFFVRSLRAVSGESDNPGLQFLRRGGFVGRCGQRANVLLPMGVRTQQRLSQLIEERLQVLGAHALIMGGHGQVPVVSCGNQLLLATADSCDPAGFWGRRFEDAAVPVIQSYRQLPVCIYAWGMEQRGFADLQGAGFDALPAQNLMGAYVAGNEVTAVDGAGAMMDVLLGVCEQSGIPAIWVPAGRGASGAVNLRRLAAVGLHGNLSLLRCSGCGVLEDATCAQIRKPSPPAGAPRPMVSVATPGCKTILELCRCLGVAPAQTAKSIFLMDQAVDGRQRFVIAVVRGDTDFNANKLARRLGVDCLRPATEVEIRQAGAEPGYGSPVGLQGVTVVADELIVRSANLVAGANREGFHLLDVNYGRDFQVDIVMDVVLAKDADLCPRCGQPLKMEPAVELGWLGLPLAEPDTEDGVQYSDAAGQSHKAPMVAFGFFAHRLLAAIAELHLDERGLTWPAAVAPFDVYLMTIGQPESQAAYEAEQLYSLLTANGLSVLYDDRDERAGVKFNDADLFGIPVRVVVGERGLRENAVEIKARLDAEAQKIPLDGVLLHLGIARGNATSVSADDLPSSTNDERVN